MRTFVAAVNIALVVGCAVNPPKPWHPVGSGCTSRSIHETLAWFEDAPLSTASFRVAVTPDTGQGPTVLAILDSGKLINLGNLDDPPAFVGVVGDSERSCVVRMDWEQCHAATGVYENLKQQSLPLGFEFDSPADILVLHAPTYYLGFSDGQGNHNQWRFYGLRHPLQTVIQEALASLRPCWQEAEHSYNAF